MNRLHTRFLFLGVALAALWLISGCSYTLIEFPTLEPITPQATDTPIPSPTPFPQTEYTFQALVPDDTPPGASVMLEVVDEVTGAGLHPQRFPMEQVDTLTYRLVLRFPVGSVVKYRYVRTAPTPATEATPLGETVRYRMAVVQGPGLAEDRVARWADGEYRGGTGSIAGQVWEADSREPLPGLMVLAGGRRTFTRSDGSFVLSGLPVGKQTLVVYDPQGWHQPFQQGAVIAEGLTTPAELYLTARPPVNITFQVTPPAGHLKGAPIRLAGNLYALGNTFADLPAGESTLASRMPTLSLQPDGSYTLTLRLPAGADLRYKYTLGDGFWNAERDPNGNFYVRQLIVPPADTVIHDQIYRWSSGTAAPVFFDVRIPADTPATDTISLQLNPGLWMAPLPMWPLGEQHWGLRLYGPMDLMQALHYRYCRSDLCDLSAEAGQSGPLALGHFIEPKRIEQHPVDTVTAWQNWSAPAQTVVQAPDAHSRAPGFVKGVAWLPAYAPGWQAYIPRAMHTIAGYQANTVLLSPTWTFTFLDPLTLDVQPGEDMLWEDLQATLQAAQNAGLTAVLFPQPRFAGGPAAWWAKAPQDPAWWDAWFTAYTAFALHFARLAESYHLPRLILGGPAVLPALPGGQLPDGSPAHPPADAAQRWRTLLAEVHNQFHGEVWWAMTPPQEPTAAPPFLDQLDGLYLQFRLPLSDRPDADIATLQTEAGRLLDGRVLPFQVHADRPLWLAIAYPAAQGGVTGCVVDSQGNCLSPDDLAPSPTLDPAVRVDLDEQRRAYNAILLAVHDRDWIQGFISEGFFPAAALQDPSPSIYGKPAAEVLRYFFQLWR